MVSVPILYDDDVLALAEMGELVALVENCLRARAAGRLVAPPRHTVAFGDRGKLVFTIGGVDRDESPGAAGFRVYETFAGAGRQRAQLVAVWNGASGDLLGLIIGDALGAWRTGALGGVAVKHMARPGASACAVIGSGQQAETQLLAAAAVRPLACVRVYSRSAANRQAFADRLSSRLGCRIEAVGSTREAVADADIVLCATDSPEPVLETGWLAPGAHVTSVGPKLVDGHELPRDIGKRATFVATDSPEQMRAYPKPHFLAGTPAEAAMRDLAEIVTAGEPRRRAADLSLYCSVGLAGTEVAIAEHLLRRAAVG